MKKKVEYTKVAKYRSAHVTENKLDHVILQIVTGITIYFVYYLPSWISTIVVLAYTG